MFLRAFTVVAALLAASAAGAQSPLPVPTVGYSADRVMETEAGTFTGRVHAMPDRDRSETTVGDMSSVVILRRDLQSGWMLMPSQKLYRELDFGEARKQAGAAPGDVTIEAAGPDTIEGVETTKYKLRMKDGSAGGFMWFTADGIPVRMDMLTKNGRKTERMTVTLKNLQIGPQDPSLFEPPADYSRMGVFPAMNGLGGFSSFGRKRSTGN